MSEPLWGRQKLKPYSAVVPVTSTIQTEVSRDEQGCCTWLRVILGGRVLGQASITDRALVMTDKADLPALHGDAIKRLRLDYKERMDKEALQHALDSLTAPYRQLPGSAHD